MLKLTLYIKITKRTTTLTKADNSVSKQIKLQTAYCRDYTKEAKMPYSRKYHFLASFSFIVISGLLY